MTESSTSQTTWWRRLLRACGYPLRRMLTLLIGLYQRYISPMRPPTCRYHPSCSSYAARALQQHGVVKGVVLSSWRLLRCNPWSPGGVDNVPEPGRWRPDPYRSIEHDETGSHAAVSSKGA